MSSAELWVRAQARLTQRPRGAGRPAGTGKATSPLYGLLRCGICGGSFVVISRRYKDGDPSGHANYGCATNRSRGHTICANARTLSEKKATEGAVRALKEQLTRPDLVAVCRQLHEAVRRGHARREQRASRSRSPGRSRCRPH
jgi:hypothetical protein